jgi:hypothetical protein
VKRKKEAALRNGIMQQVAALQAFAQPAPDAWMRLVLDRMSLDELKAEAEKADDKSAEELRWIKEELRRRS